MADLKSAYGAATAITVTLASLASGSGRASAVVANGTDKFLDALVRLTVAGAAGTTGTVDVYAYAGLGDGTYTDVVGGTDAAATRRNAVWLGSIQMAASVTVVSQLMSVAAAFGGRLPSQWGIIVVNNSGAALAGSGHAASYQGVYASAA